MPFLYCTSNCKHTRQWAINELLGNRVVTTSTRSVLYIIMVQNNNKLRAWGSTKYYARLQSKKEYEIQTYKKQIHHKNNKMVTSLLAISLLVDTFY